MEKFSTIYQRAAERKGGKAALNSLLPDVADSQALSANPDSYFLAEMTRKIFQSGFVWRIIDQKWAGFEQVFWQFEPQKMRLASDEQIEKMAQNKQIVRHLTKVKSVRDNAFFVDELSKQYNGFGRFLAQWPADDTVGLWLYLKKHGSRLGGNTGAYFLRVVGKDSFILSRDVVGYLVAHQLVDKHPTSKRDLTKTQQIFNQWREQSGLPLAHISRILSCSVGDNFL